MGKYSIARELYAHPGYVTVYEAVQEGLGKKVEIRLLAQKVANESAELARFQSEIKTLAILDHPHILRVLDCGANGGRLYYVTDHKVAATLLELVTRDPCPLTLEDKVRIATQLAGALKYMHSKGVLHRGLDLTSVCYDPDVSAAYISQFCFIKNLRTDSLTSRGIPTAMPMLSTPEGVLGQLVDARTDVFQLGCLLFRLLTGQDAYPVEKFLGLTADALRSMPARSLKDVDPAAFEPLTAVVDKAIALIPDKRHTSAGQLEDALNDVQKKLKLPRAKAPGTMRGVDAASAKMRTSSAPPEADAKGGEKPADGNHPSSATFKRSKGGTGTPTTPATVSPAKASPGRFAALIQSQRDKLKIWAAVAALLLAVGIALVAYSVM